MKALSRRDFGSLVKKICFVGVGISVFPNLAGCQSVTVLEDLQNKGVEYTVQNYSEMGMFVSGMVLDGVGYQNLTFEIVNLDSSVEFPSGAGVSVETVSFVSGTQTVRWRADGEEIII